MDVRSLACIVPLVSASLACAPEPARASDTVTPANANIPLLKAGPKVVRLDEAGDLPAREFRAVWVATVDNIDWPSKRGIGTEKAAAELRAILDKAKLLNLNAVILQVRPSADAFYASKIEPWSEYLTGQQGKAPQPYWDPLAYAVQEAHRRGLELHCWFNPYRAWHPAAKGKPSRNYVGLTNRSAVRSYGRYQWMDPGERDTQERSMSVMMDVARRYDIDGVHIDDYFYPYKEKGADGRDLDFPDDVPYRRYVDGGGKLSKDDWRRANVDRFIESFYKTLKRERPWIKFGISPFGIYRPGVPEGIKAGVDQYADLYADCLKWWRNGWCDYFSPQLYWPISQTAQSYPTLLNWWLEQNAQKRHLWIGNYTGRTDPGNGNWKASEVTAQIDTTRTAGAGGNIHFSMKCLMKNWNGIADALESGVYASPALVPSSPWLDDRNPAVPRPVRTTRYDGYWEAHWRSEGEPIRFYVVSALQGGQWTGWSVSSESAIRVGIDQVSPPVEKIAVTAIDRCGNASSPLIIAAP